MSVSRVLVTGASGQLGVAIVRAFADREVIAHTHGSLDIGVPEAVRRAVDEARPDAIINCAAYNHVDAAETHALDAFAANAFAVRTLARAAESAGALLVHYGTDFVFAGVGDSDTPPYDEATPPAPGSVYAASKLVGEWLALEYRRGYVLRVESLFGQQPDWTGRRGSLDTIVAGLDAGREVPVFTDRIVSPSYVADVAAATRFIVDGSAAPGLYHCVNSGHASWEQVALEAARILGVTPRLKRLSTAEVKLIAARPRFCALSNEKLAAAGLAMPTWQDALGRWLASRGRLTGEGRVSVSSHIE